MSEGKTVGEKLRDIRNLGLENTLGRYYSAYPAKVESVDDPQQQGRVRVSVNGIGLPGPIPRMSYPVSPYAGENFGFYFPPHEDSNAWVTFDHGDVNAPRFIGSWWPNKDKEKSPRRPIKSYVPAEFIKDDGSAPTARGIKIKEGHGLVFEGDPETSYVELWTGENQEIGTFAKRRHRMRFDDAAEEIVISTFGTGDDDATYDERDHHELRMVDKENNRKVQLKTIGKDSQQFHKVLLEETPSSKQILVESTEGHFVQIDDVNENSTWSMKAEPGQSAIRWLLDKKNQFMQGSTPGNRKLTLDDNNQYIRLEDDDHVIAQDTSGTLISDSTGTQISVTGDGDLSVSFPGGDANTIIGGNRSDTVGGSHTQTVVGTMDVSITGGWFQRVTGAAQMLFASNLQIDATNVVMNVGSMTVNSATVKLGTGALTTLVKAPFLAKYTAHTHNTTIAGAPTGPPITGTVDSNDTTIVTTAA